MRSKASKAAIVAVAGVVALAGVPGSAAAGTRPNIMQVCTSCHTGTDGSIRGKMVSVSEQFKSISVSVGPLVWIVKYGDDLKVKEGEKLSGPETLKGIPRDKEILITYTGEETQPFAARVAVKQPYKVPEAQVLPLEKMKELIALGPEQGKFFLYDSRPTPLFPEGHIPYAQSLPYAGFKEQAAAKLPADKGALVIFYCGGDT
jgi:hypothetical protein